MRLRRRLARGWRRDATKHVRARCQDSPRLDAARGQGIERRADQSGFTIVESLVAATFLTLVLVAAEWGVIGTMSAASVAREYSEATSLVAQTVAQAESDNDVCPSSQPILDGISYQVAASCSSPVPADGTVKVVVTVTWKSPTGGTEKVVGGAVISQS